MLEFATPKKEINAENIYQGIKRKKRKKKIKKAAMILIFFFTIISTSNSVYINHKLNSHDVEYFDTYLSNLNKEIKDNEKYWDISSIQIDYNDSITTTIL